MTFEDQLIRRGRQEGRQEGERVTKLGIAKNMLAQHFDPKTVQQLVQLNQAELDQLESMSE